MNVQPVTPPPVRDPVGLITAKLHVALNGFFLQLPNIVGGLIFVLIGWVVARLAAAAVRRAFHHRDRIDLGGVLASLVFGGILAAALMGAAVIVFPSVQPATVISSLGIGSVAIGFAFKDILQNLLAGILLLVNRPFRRGDQIVVKDFEGTVEHIQSRATLITTYDGRRVIIPNSDIYTSPVTVNTAFPTRRSQADIGIGFGDDVGAACEAFVAAVAGVAGVEANPAAEVLPWAVAESTITIRARWWTASKRTDVVHVAARVIQTIAETANAEGIDLAYPTRTLLFHDQTEDGDGDRRRQREGWPAGEEG